MQNCGTMLGIQYFLIHESFYFITVTEHVGMYACVGILGRRDFWYSSKGSVGCSLTFDSPRVGALHSQANLREGGIAALLLSLPKNPHLCWVKL